MKTTGNKKDLSVLLNNALSFARENSVCRLTPGKYKEFSQELIKVPLECVDEGYLSHEDLVYILVAAALYIQSRYVCQTMKLPNYSEAKDYVMGENKE